MQHIRSQHLRSASTGVALERLCVTVLHKHSDYKVDLVRDGRN